MGKVEGGGEQSLPPIIMDPLTFTCDYCGGYVTIEGAVNVDWIRRELRKDSHILTDDHYFCNNVCEALWKGNRDAIRLALEVLGAVEWSWQSVQICAPICPVCKGFKVEGHKEGCELERAMEMLDG